MRTVQEGEGQQMKLNHFICPNCGHDFFSDCAYATCDSCQCMFYASQSITRTLHNPTLKGEVFVNGVPFGQWYQVINSGEKK